MKYLIPFLFVCLPLFAVAQALDSVAVVKQVDSLIDASKKTTDRKDYNTAMSLAEQAKSLAETQFGANHAVFARACYAHALVFSKKGDMNEAEQLYLQTKAIWESLGLQETTDYVKTLGNLALVYDKKRQYDKSMDYFRQTLAAKEKIFGPDHVECTKEYYNMGIHYYETGKLAEAEQNFSKALSIREKAGATSEEQYFGTLNNLAIIYMATGHFEKAEQCWEKIKTTCEQNNLTVYLTYTRSLANLSTVYQQLGKYEKAEPLLVQSLARMAKDPGKGSSEYATVLNNLAGLYFRIGDFERAEVLFSEAYSLRAGLKGKVPEDFAASLNNMGNLYLQMGNHQRAEALFLEAMAVYDTEAKKKKQNYGGLLHSLSAVYLYQNKLEKAESLLNEALTVQRQAIGEKHPDYAYSLINLGTIYLHQKAYGKAEKVFYEALDNMANALGESSPDFGFVSYSLGELYRQMGQYDRSLAFYNKTSAIFDEKIGLEHPYQSQLRQSLALLEWEYGTRSEAVRQLLENRAVEKNRFLKASRHLSERELQHFLQHYLKDLYLQFSLSQQIAVDTFGLLGNNYDNLLFYKGLLLNTSTQIKRKLLADATLANQFYDLKAYHRALAEEYAKPISERKNVAETEEKANNLEKMLARQVAGFSDAVRQVTWQEVQAALKPGEAAVEFVQYGYRNPGITDSVMYSAILLRKGMTQPLFVPLFEEKRLQEKLNLHKVRRSDYVNDLYATKNPNNLYEMLWKPLQPYLDSVSMVYYSPAGLLHYLNLGAITIPSSNTPLNDHYQFVELSSTRQLVVSNPVAPTVQTAFLFGGIQYAADSIAIAQAIADVEANTLASIRAEIGFEQADSTLRGGGSWDYLKWTEREVANLENRLVQNGIKAVSHKGYAGTEEAFKAIGKNGPSPRILHVATHGFFFPNPQIAKEALPQIEIGDRGNLGSKVFKISDHPMMRSGLVLAGANYAWANGKPLKPGMEDGILTAYEISQMDLSATELVVLSACETGLGDVQGNEGVYGLQRAFKMAGAKYLVMSLWQVPDFQTQELMAAFYTKWLEQNMSIPDAFRSAQREMRERFQHPYFWAGFVLVE